MDPVELEELQKQLKNAQFKLTYSVPRLREVDVMYAIRMLYTAELAVAALTKKEVNHGS